MRRILTVLLTATALLGAVGAAAQQQQSPGSQRREQETEDSIRKQQERQRRIDREFQRDQLPLPDTGAAGACPYVKVLYDAARTIDFDPKAPSASQVGWSGEIEGVSATCRYAEDEPIVVEVITTFNVGKGPRAQGNSTTLPYFIAVTDRDRAILGKERFSVTARVPNGDDRVLVYDRVEHIVIPRATAGVSGSQFEVLVGFEVTPEMAEFNRQGSRFRVTAGTQQAANPATPPAQP